MEKGQNLEYAFERSKMEAAEIYRRHAEAAVYLDEFLDMREEVTFEEFVELAENSFRWSEIEESFKERIKGVIEKWNENVKLVQNAMEIIKECAERNFGGSSESDIAKMIAKGYEMYDGKLKIIRDKPFLLVLVENQEDWNQLDLNHCSGVYFSGSSGGKTIRLDSFSLILKTVFLQDFDVKTAQRVEDNEVYRHEKQHFVYDCFVRDNPRSPERKAKDELLAFLCEGENCFALKGILMGEKSLYFPGLDKLVHYPLQKKIKNSIDALERAQVFFRTITMRKILAFSLMDVSLEDWPAMIPVLARQAEQEYLKKDEFFEFPWKRPEFVTSPDHNES